MQVGSTPLEDTSLGMLPRGGREKRAALEWAARPRTTRGSCEPGRPGAARRAEGVEAGAGPRKAHVDGCRSERGAGTGGHPGRRKAGPSGGKEGTGGRGRKQGTVPGRGRHRRVEGCACSGVAHTEFVGRGTGHLGRKLKECLVLLPEK